jgi:ribosomal protein S18 acetylase RimI-like enzyme
MTPPRLRGSDWSLVEIRRACVEDVPQLCSLLAELFAQEADFTPDAERQRRGLRLILDNPECGRIYCASHSASIVGMVSILFTVSTAVGNRVACLEDLVVHADCRGHGIGRRLLSHALAEAATAGCTRVTLLTDDDNYPAMRLYSGAGFERSKMAPFRLKLPSVNRGPVRPGPGDRPERLIDGKGFKPAHCCQLPSPDAAARRKTPSR